MIRTPSRAGQESSSNRRESNEVLFLYQWMPFRGICNLRLNFNRVPAFAWLEPINIFPNRGKFIRCCEDDLDSCSEVEAGHRQHEIRPYTVNCDSKSVFERRLNLEGGG
jgi:hypothetical protein